MCPFRSRAFELSWHWWKIWPGCIVAETRKTWWKFVSSEKWWFRGKPIPVSHHCQDKWGKLQSLKFFICLKIIFFSIDAVLLLWLVAPGPLLLLLGGVENLGREFLVMYAPWMAALLNSFSGVLDCPCSPVSLTELCSFGYGLKDLFTLHKLADKVVFDR